MNIKIEPSINSFKIEPHVNKVKIELINLKDDVTFISFISPYQIITDTDTKEVV